MGNICFVLGFLTSDQLLVLLQLVHGLLGDGGGPAGGLRVRRDLAAEARSCSCHGRKFEDCRVVGPWRGSAVARK